MKLIKKLPGRLSIRRLSDRQGTIVVFCVVWMLIVLGIAAFTIDFGVLALAKGQTQNASDCAAHAAAQELAKSFGPGATMNDQTAANNAKTKAQEMVARFQTADVKSTVLDPTRDMRVGRRSWNSTTNSWTTQWNTVPYNVVEVTVRRTAAANAPVKAVFARVFGQDSFNVTAKSVTAIAPINGFELPDGSTDTLDILPIALDLTTWNKLLDQVYYGTANGFTDTRAYSSSTGTVSSSSDSIPEVNIYPDNNSSIPAGNRGTVDIGHSGNSTNDIKRQIVHGISATDLSYMPNGVLQFNSSGILYLNGDTGISAGIESSLSQIVGQVRAIPIFTSVSGPGNNAQYTIVKFVGIRVMGVKLSGGPNNRYLRVQPAPMLTRYGIRANIPVTVDSVMSQPILVE